MPADIVKTLDKVLSEVNTANAATPARLRQRDSQADRGCGAHARRHQREVERLRADAIYLTLGLSRHYQGQYWPLVVGVHVVPDYAAAIDLEQP